jgi:Skp family chaperone for outer membrane proteins
MKNIQLIFAFLFFSTSLVAQNSNAKSIIAYIEEAVILKAATGYVQNSNDIDSLKTVYSKEIQDAKTTLQKNIDSLLAPYKLSSEVSLQDIKTRLNPADLGKFELYTKENDLITKATTNYNLVLTTMYQQKVQPILTKINKAIEDYAKTNGIKIVYNVDKIAPGLAYIDKGINITAAIVKAINGR